MSRKIISLLLAVMLLIVFGTSALAIETNSINPSGKISFKGKVKIYSVTYHKNGGEGSAPVDQNRYSASDNVTVLGQGGMIPPTGKTFAGWAAVKDATSATELPGKQLKLSGNLDLYAVWTAAPSVKVVYNYRDDANNTYSKMREYVYGETITMPTLTELGWKLPEGFGFKGWGVKFDDTGSMIAPGATQVITADKEYFGWAAADGKMEFPVTITWDDSDNYDGVRPYPEDVIKNLVLKPEPSVGSYVSAVSTSGNIWTIVWSNLEKKDYSVVVPEVEGYTKTASSKDSLTFHRDVSDVLLQIWISNKKWDKHGDLIKFKVGQDVRFRIDVTNIGNQPVKDVVVYQNLKGAKFKKSDGYSIKDGHAHVGTLNPKETVSIFSVYRVTNSDTRKEKVVNVAGVDFRIKNGGWASSWDAVRVPINKKSGKSTVTATPLPTPTPTPIPVIEYIVEKLIKDTNGVKLSYPNAVIDILGAEELMTPEEYAVYQTLNTQDKILTVLNSIGFDTLIPAERLRLNLMVSEQALNLMNTIYARKQVMTPEERATQQFKESIYFPKQSVVENGIMQNYFEISFRIRTDKFDRVDRYTFREELNGQWNFVRVIVEQ